MLKKIQLSKTVRNTTRFMAIVMMAMVAGTGFQSCSDDEEPGATEYPSEILGSWEAKRQSITTKIDGQEPQTTYDEDPQHLLDIRTNGVIESYTREQPTDQWTSEYRGAWAYNDYYRALIIAPNEDERLIYYVHNLTADQLILVYSVDGTTDDGTACVTSYATAYTRPHTQAGGM